MGNKRDFDLISFGLRLKEIRRFYGYTQREVAEGIGISDEKSIRNWENGKQLPGIDNAVNLANFYGMSVGEILEDEAYRIWNKKKDSRKRSIEIIEVPDKIEVFIEITEDRYFDRYEMWVFDEFADCKYRWASVSKENMSYSDVKSVVLNQSDEIVGDYREWLFATLGDNEKDDYTRLQIEGKIRCEKAGMAGPGCVCVDGINGRVCYFGFDNDFEDEFES